MTWEGGWRYGIISTVPYEQQKIYRQIILFQRIYYLSISLTGLPCHREPSIVLMSMLICPFCRSQVVREACVTVAYLSQELHHRVDHLCEMVLPSLIVLIPNSAKVCLLTLPNLTSFFHGTQVLFHFFMLTFATVLSLPSFYLTG